MRFFYFLLLSFPAFAQIDYGSSTTPCDETHLQFGGNIQCGSLTISNSPTWDPSAIAIDVQVNGDVVINTLSPINLNGGASSSGATFLDDFFGTAGPGADEGGHTNFGFPLSASGASGGGVGGDGVCGGGGAGGGFAEASLPGNLCGAVAGGNPGSLYSNIFSSPLRGGFGGGAGGNGPSGLLGGGGGGAGAIRIRAKGNVIINSNITAIGGAGGNSTGDGGGGGGGSGGLIWIQALGNITNNASLNADGGPGGDGDSTGGADGSAGSRGAIRLEDFDGVIDGSGTIPGYAEVLPVGGGIGASSEKLKSSISCGTVLPKNNDGLFQMMMSFMIVVLMSKMLRRRSA